MHHLEKMTSNDNPPPRVSATLVDAMFLLHSQADVPLTYGEIAGRLLRQLCAMSQRVNLVAEQYKSPSIKDVERERRGVNDTIFKINGPEQKRPSEWQKCLLSPSFKTSIMKFLSCEWMRPCYAPILEGHTLYLALEQYCYCFTAADGKVSREVDQDLQCDHEEADTRIIYHVYHIIHENEQAEVVVRANDTDIPVLLLYHLPHLPGPPKIWMDAGCNSNNTRRYIDVASITASLDAKVTDALPALHVFTGTDFTTSFLNKGKVRPFEIMVKSPAFTAYFAEMGYDHEISDEEIKCTPLEHFVCCMYGRPKIKEVNTGRYTLFEHNYAPKTGNEPLDKIKGINPSNIPPCQKVLYEKIRRVNFIASIWKNAARKEPCRLDPLNNGWYLRDGMLHVQWFQGDLVPHYIWQALENDSDTESKTRIVWRTTWIAYKMCTAQMMTNYIYSIMTLTLHLSHYQNWS